MLCMICCISNKQLVGNQLNGDTKSAVLCSLLDISIHKKIIHIVFDKIWGNTTGVADSNTLIVISLAIKGCHVFDSLDLFVSLSVCLFVSTFIQQVTDWFP